MLNELLQVLRTKVENNSELAKGAQKPNTKFLSSAIIFCVLLRGKNNTKMAWILLILGGICEVGFTTCLQASNNLTHWSKNWPWVTGFFVFLFFSMYLLNEAAKHISMGTCYAVWTGIGAVGTVLIGIFVYHEPANLLRIIFIFTLIASIVGLKIVSPAGI